MRHAQQAISSREFGEWIAYDRLSPIGDDRADLRTGIETSAIVNILAGKPSRRSRPIDFMPKFHQPAKSSLAEPAAIERNLFAFASRYNRERAKQGSA